MSAPLLPVSHRDRQILCGLFLSKFDKGGLSHLGFDGFTEAFNALGYGLQAKPASIKNYRDEFDPCFPNTRKGWRKRPLREHCQRILNAYGAVGMDELGGMIRSFLMPGREAEAIPEVKRVLDLIGPEPSSSFAKRLITGKAAERYFATHYSDIEEFSGAALTDTTAWGCGFDFKATPKDSELFRAVEVKGLRGRSGQILMTDLEFRMAEALRDRYFLVVVRNFSEAPVHSVIHDPAGSAIPFTRVERTEVRLSWSATING